MNTPFMLVTWIILALCWLNNFTAHATEQVNDFSSVYNRMIELMNQGNYAAALPLGDQCVILAERMYGEHHPKSFNCKVSLGFSYKSVGEYAKGIEHYKGCLVIADKNSDISEEYKAGVWGAMGETYLILGDYANAERAFTEAIAINERIFGNEHAKIVMNLQGLGTASMETGAYARAETACTRALAIAEKSFGGKGFEMAQSLSCLGRLHEKIGDHGKAEQFHQRALASAGKTNPEIVASLIDKLALLYYSTGKYAKAVSLYERSRVLKEKSLGKEHPEVVSTLNNLGMCHDGQGNQDKAISLYKQSIAITKKTLGDTAPGLTAPLNNLAVIYLQRGQYAIAESHLKQALAIKEKQYGLDFHQSVFSLYSLSLTESMQGRYISAWEYLRRVNAIDDLLIGEVFAFTSEKQKMAYLARTNRSINLSLQVVTHLSTSVEHVRDGFNLWLRRKGLVLESQKQFQEALLHSGDAATKIIYERLSTVRAELSKLILAGPGTNGLDTYQQNVRALESQKEAAERELTGHNQSFATELKKGKADCIQIAQSLPPKTVLIDFARIEPSHIGTGSAWSPSHYIAFVLHAGNSDQVTVVDLGEAEMIEALMAQLSKTMEGNSETPPTSRKSAESVTNVARLLYKSVFKPLRAHLSETQVVYISPDGVLNLLPFEILTDDTGRFLIEEYTFNYLAAGRDILGFGHRQSKPGKNLIIGNPDFNLDDNSREKVVGQLNLQRGNRIEAPSISRNFRNFRFRLLPETQLEVDAVRSVLDEKSSEFFVGREALEEVLNSRIAPKILHLATHGFYLRDRDLGPPEDTQIKASAASASGSESKRAPHSNTVLENPLIRSGIALAGANNSLARKSGNTDGLVTAEKILNLNLVGTELVVLSACESGQGEVKSGEGVFGLRRAFSQAGAKSMIMSMWSVPDLETRELMTAFYKNIQANSMNRVQALRQAALQEMELVKKRYGHASPFFWGAFIFAGEP